MKRLYLLALFLVMSLAVATPVFAQIGCDDSPEDPTVVLALVSGAGIGVTYLRSRWLGKREQ